MPRITIHEGEGAVIEVDAPDKWKVGVVSSVGDLYEGAQGQPVRAIFVDEGRVSGLYHLPPNFEMNISLQGLGGGEIVGRVNFVGLGKKGFSNFEELRAGQKVRSRRGAVWAIANLQGKREW